MEGPVTYVKHEAHVIYRRAMERVQSDLDRSKYAGESLALAYIGGADPHWVVAIEGHGYRVDAAPLGKRPRTEAIATVEVALSAKDAFIGILQIEWPTCPTHTGYPVNPAINSDGRAVWRCERGDGHVLGEIGSVGP